MFGDNNANRTAWVATGAPVNRERIARAWRVQEKGNIGTVTIQAPASTSSATVKLPLERDGMVYLLVSASGDFVNDVTEVPMTLNGANWEGTYDFTSGQYFTFATNDACVSTTSLLTTYNAVTAAAVDKCYVNGWILFKDPVDASRFIAAIYDPTALIDRTKISASLNVNSAFADLGKGNSSQACRLMRRMLQLDCANCYNAGANPNPNFIVRMFYSPVEKSDAETVETNNMEAIKTANGLTASQIFKWFKASGKTVANVTTNLSPSGIQGSGQEWFDGSLPTGQVDGVDYVDFVNVNSFSTFGGIWAVNMLTVLPVNWLDVQATPENNRSVHIKWGTASQIRNSRFEVEKSEDGINYQVIAIVPENGSTAGTSWYAADDYDVEIGIKYFYRIRQIDIDGRFSYSKVVLAQLKGEGISVKLVPNPVRDQLRVQIITGKQEDLKILITDVSGQVLSVKKCNVQAGRNSYIENMLGHTDGTYFIRIITADGTVIIKKFILQKGR